MLVMKCLGIAGERGLIHCGLRALVIGLSAFVLLLPNAAYARRGKRLHHHAIAHRTQQHHRYAIAHRKEKSSVRKAAAAVPPMRAAILVDTESGAVLREANADRRLYPASLTKMMTLYLTFAALNDGSLSLDRSLPVSAHAAAQEPTKLWLKPGQTVTVHDLILGIVTRSANDAAVVLAEAIGGSETAFAKKMTAAARRLGMADTVFRNASGLPDPEQMTTARDVARLALALYHDFPREYDYFSVRKFNFRGKTIAGHNHLLGAYDGADGIKTGFTHAAGFNLAASAVRHGERLVGVVLGSPSWRVRDKQMMALLDRGFAELGRVDIADQDTVLPSPTSRKPKGLAARVAAFTAPIAKAHAEPILSPASAIRHGQPRHGTHLIQVGAVRTRAAARRLALNAAHLVPAKSNAVHLAVAKRSKSARYTVRISGFTASGARHACVILKRKRLPCVVLAAAD